MDADLKEVPHAFLSMAWNLSQGVHADQACSALKESANLTLEPPWYMVNSLPVEWTCKNNCGSAIITLTLLLNSLSINKCINFAEWPFDGIYPFREMTNGTDSEDQVSIKTLVYMFGSSTLALVTLSVALSVYLVSMNIQLLFHLPLEWVSDVIINICTCRFTENRRCKTEGHGRKGWAWQGQSSSWDACLGKLLSLNIFDVIVLGCLNKLV